MLSDEEIFLLYGRNSIISRTGRFVLVHLDRPSAQVVRARTESFDPEVFFGCDCNICRTQKAGGVIIFDDFSNDDDEEILLE